jgi:alkylhydroperoxidase/carboxymuconolactone decarboxylase family protein YurZ
MPDARELLRDLARSGHPPRGLSGDGQPYGLDRQTRALVQLSALLAGDAGTAALRCAADNAAAAGVDDATLVSVLVTAATANGVAQTVKSAPRLALALDVDIEVDGWDGT